MQVTDYVAALDARISEFDMLKHPFYRAWAAGALRREDLREYASIYFDHIVRFPTYLSTFHSQLPDGELRRAVARNLCDEEIAGPAHSELWLDFAEGMGAERQSVKRRGPIPEFRSLADTFRELMETTVGALAALYAYESQVPAVTLKLLKALYESYGADSWTCQYFDLHCTADVRHAVVWLEQLNILFSLDPGGHSEAINGATRAARALWRGLDGIERLRLERVEGNSRKRDQSNCSVSYVQ